MVKLNLVSDEASLLKTYGVSSLAPKCVIVSLRPISRWLLFRKWEVVDHEKVDTVAGALTGVQGDVEGDPLGLRRGSIPE